MPDYRGGRSGIPNYSMSTSSTYNGDVTYFVLSHWDDGEELPPLGGVREPLRPKPAPPSLEMALVPA